MRHIMITVAYDGTNYIGWQRQDIGKGMSIQGALEQAAYRLLGEPVTIAGAGRTDAGVHAWGQRAAFHTEKKIPIAQVPYAFNCVLPRDIRVRQAVEVADDFHVRFDAKSKHYRYVFLQGSPDVFSWRQAYFLSRPVDISLMQQGAELFCGEHNFQAFTVNSRREIASYRRTITRCQFQPLQYSNEILPEIAPLQGYALDVEGEGFLYKMVRLIAGSLLALGQGALSLEQLQQALRCGKEILAPPLPAQGLTLVEVKYKQDQKYE